MWCSTGSPAGPPGRRDAERKCSKVTGYTKWFFYDSPFDDLDFVLCLKEHKAL